MALQYIIENVKPFALTKYNYNAYLLQPVFGVTHNSSVQSPVMLNDDKVTVAMVTPLMYLWRHQMQLP